VGQTSWPCNDFFIKRVNPFMTQTLLSLTLYNALTSCRVRESCKKLSALVVGGRPPTKELEDGCTPPRSPRGGPTRWSWGGAATPSDIGEGLGHPKRLYGWSRPPSRNSGVVLTTPNPNSGWLGHPRRQLEVIKPPPNSSGVVRPPSGHPQQHQHFILF
jgi:hypothetical protein